MQVFSTDEAFGCACAKEIQAVLAKKPDAVVCIAAGTTSIPVFDALLKMKQEGSISFSDAVFFGMDEWLGMPQDADGAMADFLRKHFLDRACFKTVFLFDGMADPISEINRAERFLSDRPIDIVLFGIGVNGHVALNEPGVDSKLSTHIAEVTETSATAARKYFEGEAPKLEKGVTIGLANIVDTPQILLTANTKNKAPVFEKIQKQMHGDSTELLPSAFVARLPQTEIIITDDVLKYDSLKN